MGGPDPTPYRKFGASDLVVTNPGKDQEVANASIAVGPDKGWVATTSDVLFLIAILTAMLHPHLQEEI